jgi:hypothetical protein
MEHPDPRGEPGEQPFPVERERLDGGSEEQGTAEGGRRNKDFTLKHLRISP